MNWINVFELLCYGITAALLTDILTGKRWDEFRLFCSAALAGFILELLAVRVTGIYHYSTDFYLNIGFAPYQFPFFGGLMWGGLTVCALRLARKFGADRLTTALLSGWLLVSMDLLLDVAAIRLNGGFWVWEGREITLDVTHHMFMSVIWVNFLGYLFETPAVVWFTLKAEANGKKKTPLTRIGQTVLIGLGGVAVVGAASGISLFLNGVTDEWFSCAAFVLLWGFIAVRLGTLLFKRRKTLIIRRRGDIVPLMFWTVMYGYCLAALGHLGILVDVPLYAVFAILLAALTFLLCLLREKRTILEEIE